MQYKLNIYDDAGQVVKTYTADKFDVKLKTINTAVSIIKPDEYDPGNTMMLGFRLMAAWNQVVPMLIDMFPGLTSDEAENAKLSDVIEIAVQLFRYFKGEIAPLMGDKGKN